MASFPSLDCDLSWKFDQQNGRAAAVRETLKWPHAHLSAYRTQRERSDEIEGKKKELRICSTSVNSRPYLRRIDHGPFLSKKKTC